MGVTKQLISPGTSTDKPKAGDEITMEYTGNLYDANAPNNKGTQYVHPFPPSLGPFSGAVPLPSHHTPS